VKSADRLVDIYCQSVGRNSKLLLNVPPTREGIIHPTDEARLLDFAAKRAALFSSDLARGRSVRWRRSGETTADAEVDLGRSVTSGVLRLEEDITRGQAIARYRVEGSDTGEWRPLSRGTTIGYAKIDRFEPAAFRRIRVVIEEAVAPPEPIAIKVFGS
jgi:alpha-L-fucosidase